jgi:hypothetical protein
MTTRSLRQRIARIKNQVNGSILSTPTPTVPLDMLQVASRRIRLRLYLGLVLAGSGTPSSRVGDFGIMSDAKPPRSRECNAGKCSQKQQNLQRAPHGLNFTRMAARISRWKVQSGQLCCYPLRTRSMSVMAIFRQLRVGYSPDWREIIWQVW